MDPASFASAKPQRYCAVVTSMAEFDQRNNGEKFVCVSAFSREWESLGVFKEGA